MKQIIRNVFIKQQNVWQLQSSLLSISLTFSEPWPQEYGEKLKLKSQNSGHSHSTSKQIKLYSYNTLESSLKYSVKNHLKKESPKNNES